MSLSFVFTGHELPQKSFDELPQPVISVTHPHYPPASRQQAPGAASLAAPGRRRQEHVCRSTLSPVSCWQDWAPGSTTKFPSFSGPPGDKTPVWKEEAGKMLAPVPSSSLREAVHLAQCPVSARLARMQLEDLASRSCHLCTALAQ